MLLVLVRPPWTLFPRAAHSAAQIPATAVRVCEEPQALVLQLGLWYRGEVQEASRLRLAAFAMGARKCVRVRQSFRSLASSFAKCSGFMYGWRNRTIGINCPVTVD